VNIGDADPLDAVPDIGPRPVLIIHGTLDPEDPPTETAEVMYAALRDTGSPVELIYCEGAGHGGLPEFCAPDYGRWVSTFFADALLGS
jgi:dipeptidyl aminopeptidase/acylaminoacyl peptidase